VLWFVVALTGDSTYIVEWLPVEQIPTCYGSVSLVAKLADRSGTFDVQCSGSFHARPNHVVLRVPPVPGLTKVKLNGESHAAPKEIEFKAH